MQFAYGQKQLLNKINLNVNYSPLIASATDSHLNKVFCLYKENMMK